MVAVTQRWPAPTPPSFAVGVCSQAAHAALKADPAAWSALRFVGFTYAPDGRVLELRQCPCGSTLGRWLTEKRSDA